MTSNNLSRCQNICHYVNNPSRHQIRHDVMTSKSSSWRQKVCHGINKVCYNVIIHGAKSLSWRQKVRHRVKNTSCRLTRSLSWRQKYVMTSKSSNQKYAMMPKSSSWPENTLWFQKLKNTQWRQKGRHDVKKVRHDVKICHDVKKARHDINDTSWRQRVC